jgi:hypothetical protein
MHSHCHRVDMARYLGLIKICCVRKVVYLGLIKIGCARKVVYLNSIKIGCVCKVLYLFSLKLVGPVLPIQPLTSKR